MRRRLTEDLSDKAEELAKNSKDKKTKKLMEKTVTSTANDCIVLSLSEDNAIKTQHLTSNCNSTTLQS